MRLAAEALVARLAGPGAKLPPVTWIHGDEPLLAIEAADAVRAAARAAGYAERQVVSVDRSFRASALAAQAGSLSLFAEQKLVEVRFGPGKPGKEASAAIGAYLREIGDDLRLLVTSARLDGFALKSEPIAAVERAGWLVAAEPVGRDALPRWIARRLAAQGQRADEATLALLAERVEGNLVAAQQEIRKLGLLCPQGPLSADEVRAAVADVSRFDVFDAVDAMLAGDAPRTVRALDGLRAEGEPVQKVLWWVADSVRKLVRLHAARGAGQPMAQVLGQLRIFGDRQRAFQRAMARVDAPRAQAMLLRAAEIDRIGKGVAAGDAWQELLALAAAVAGAPDPRGA